ncbi:MAG: type II toxin-antitoxin system HicB family antitoxin [Alphaproteobacteria bacterium]|nr:type II toxin-antitoxin system HicB family antitoxin [Alphaproteobacteria bacterium]
MAQEARRYPALIGKDDDSDWNVEFPEFPGCVTAGGTLEEAAAFAREAPALHAHGMRADGEAVPAPSDAAALMSSRRAAALVLVELPR